MLGYIIPTSFLDLSQTLFESNRISASRSVCNKGSLLTLTRYGSPVQCSFGKVLNYLDHSFKRNHPEKKMIAFKKNLLALFKNEINVAIKASRGVVQDLEDKTI